MNGYTKLFSDIIASTIWQEPNDMRVLWITLLAMKDRSHVCNATVPYLAKVCNITIEQCEEYMERFQRPDKHSRSQEYDGRRIEPVDGGWFILNGEKYREKMSKDERREQVRVAQKRFRDKKKPLPHESQNHQGRRLKPNGKGHTHETLLDRPNED